MKILTTGGCGFIGSHFIEELLKNQDIEKIYNVDLGTYAANENLPFEANPKYERIIMDISSPCSPCEIKHIESLNLDYVIHFAAESHVDNSISGPRAFVDTNIVGTFNLLEVFKSINIKRFIHVSTDEVFGSLEIGEAAFTANSRYKPNSPYSATKAASDLLVRSYVKTYKFPAIITNCSNNFGSRQNTEKMIPVCIKSLKNKTPIPIYGSGNNIRDWIYVKDHVSSLMAILFEGQIGGQYLIGGDNEISNIQLIALIKNQYEIITKTEVNWKWNQHIEDRKGHDLRYAIDTQDFKKEFPQVKNTNFEEALRDTVKSFL